MKAIALGLAAAITLGTVGTAAPAFAEEEVIVNEVEMVPEQEVSYEAPAEEVFETASVSENSSDPSEQGADPAPAEKASEEASEEASEVGSEEEPEVGSKVGSEEGPV